jgi:hypothetical protein
LRFVGATLVVARSAGGHKARPYAVSPGHQNRAYIFLILASSITFFHLATSAFT